MSKILIAALGAPLAAPLVLGVLMPIVMVAGSGPRSIDEVAAFALIVAAVGGAYSYFTMLLFGAPLVAILLRCGARHIGYFAGAGAVCGPLGLLLFELLGISKLRLSGDFGSLALLGALPGAVNGAVFWWLAFRTGRASRTT